jgi:hypothetical protein
LKPAVAEELINLISPLRDAIHAAHVRYHKNFKQLHININIINQELMTAAYPTVNFEARQANSCCSNELK